jgi:integrase
MAKKRGNGASAIYRRKNGCWSAQYEVYTPKGCKRRILYGKTRAEVAAKLAQRMADAKDMRSIKGR